MPDRRSSPGAIPRRDFLDGIALAIGATALPGALRPAHLWPWATGPGDPEQDPGYYPPALTGMRGSHDGSFELAHRLRDGGMAELVRGAERTGETYDLVVVGGGISGLAAAYFHRQQAGRSARILVLENHDDIGGHAKRNEFTVDGRRLIGYGGTQSIQAPKFYSATAKRLLAELGVRPARLASAFDTGFFARRKLGSAIFFDREAFGEDRLVTGVGARSWGEVLAQAPLSPAGRAEAERMFTTTEDPLASRTLEEKIELLRRISYREYLERYLRLPAEALRLVERCTHGEWGAGIEAVPAYEAWLMSEFTGLDWGLGYPGFKGLAAGAAMPPEAERMLANFREPYIYHFPDGNASLVRLLVRALVPGSLPGHTMEDVVTARLDYARLDVAGAPVRVRLNSTVAQVRHVGGRGASRGVEVTYLRGGRAYTVRARATVLACWNGIIPHLCPELPARQQEALRYGVKVPLVYTNVALRNWRAFDRLGIQDVTCPQAYFPFFTLDFPVSLGQYRYPERPEEPIVLWMLRTPCSPGKPEREQHRIGRAELLATPFEVFEANIRDQLDRALGGGGFDAARDIAAITVNRWSHGYAYDQNSLDDPDWPDGASPPEVGRQRFGRIAIANADSAGRAYTDAAIDMAWRAVQELHGHA